MATCRTAIRRARIASLLLAFVILADTVRAEPARDRLALAGHDIVSHALLRALATHSATSPSASRFQDVCPPARTTSSGSLVVPAKCQLAPSPEPGPQPPTPTPTPGPAPEPAKPQFAYHPPGDLLEKDKGRGRAADRLFPAQVAAPGAGSAGLAHQGAGGVRGFCAHAVEHCGDEAA